MDNEFLNRRAELALLDDLSQKSGLVVVFGRRRIGKTRLLTEWLRRRGGIYVQAIESSSTAQLNQLYYDIAAQHDFGVVPKNWSEFFKILETFPGKLILAIDEFPYLVESDKSIPSMFQKWLDHRKKKDILLILSGSSQTMMHDALLNRSSPLYGRALREIRVEEMGYPYFCRVLGLKVERIESFIWFSVTGGVPWYWSLMDPKRGLFKNLERLYFDSSPILENEAKRLLSDEKVFGLIPLSVLETIGHGAARPSEIGARLQIPQTQLSKTFEALIDSGFLRRESPPGEKKRVHYVIQDPVLRFWFTVRQPHATRWPKYSSDEKMHVLRIFASGVFEEEWRKRYPGSKRYWEPGLEIDVVGPNIVAEVKFKLVTTPERKKIELDLRAKWERSQLSTTTTKPAFRILDFAAYVKATQRR